MNGFRCDHCGRPLYPYDRSTGTRVVGWQFKGQNGGSDIKLRKTEPVFIHLSCVEKLRIREGRYQEALL